jgi:hypothetical protein
MRCEGDMHGTLIFGGFCASPAQVVGFAGYAQSFPQAGEPYKHRGFSLWEVFEQPGGERPVAARAGML